MQVVQISIGRFHHFHAARQLEKKRLLKSIYTGYPSFKLKDEQGISKDRIKTFPYIHGPYMKRGALKLNRFNTLNRLWVRCGQVTLDHYVASKLDEAGVLFALSGSALKSGKKMQRLGGYHICDRGSSHIRYQDNILKEEYKRWGYQFQGVDPYIIEREEKEYESADVVTVPSQFVFNSFLEMGVPKEKLRKVTYGARLDRFKKCADPDPNAFTVLWVGGISIRKGFIDALRAFNELKHPQKRFLVVGHIDNNMNELLATNDLSEVEFVGNVPNAQLPLIYSKAHVFILPSLEEGLAMVQGEALACGCPVIASTNTGSSDLFTDGEEGYIVPIRSSEIIVERLQQLADDPVLRNRMSEAALRKVNSIGGWDSYGDQLETVVNGLIKPC